MNGAGTSQKELIRYGYSICMPREGYSSLTFPTEFLQTIIEFLEKCKKHGINLGYNGPTDFLKDGARELMMKIETTLLLGVPEE